MSPAEHGTLGESDGAGDLHDRLTAARPRPDSSVLDRITYLIESSAPGAGRRPRVGAQIAAFAAAGFALLTVAAAVTFL